MKEKSTWTYIHTMVGLYFFAWGFSAFDRLLIASLFPFLLPEFHLNFTKAGLLMTVMSIGYIVMTFTGGMLSDRYGRKKVILPAVTLYSLGSFITGFASNLWQLIIYRVIVGGGEGAYMPAGSGQISEESSPARRGLFLGIHASAFAWMGMFIAPIYGTQIGASLGWRWAFWLTIIPGIVLVLLIKFKIKESPRFERKHAAQAQTQEQPGQKAEKARLVDVLKEKNIILCVVGSMCWMGWVWSWLAFGTVFLTHAKGFDPRLAGIVLSGFGLGGGIGMIVVPGISDRWGRKLVLLLSALVACTVSVVIAQGPTNPVILFLLLGITSFTGWGLGPLLFAIVPTESVSFERAALAVALGAGGGELVGTTVAPMVLGHIGDVYGLAMTMTAGAACLIPIALFMAARETCPRIVAARQAQAELKLGTSQG